MNDELNKLEQKLARHRPAPPNAALRRRIAALPQQHARGSWWQGIAAAILAVLALLQMVLSGGSVTPPPPASSAQAAWAGEIHQLNLPLDDHTTRLLADNLAAGARLRPIPEIHGRPAFYTELRETP